MVLHISARRSGTMNGNRDVVMCRVACGGELGSGVGRNMKPKPHYNPSSFTRGEAGGSVGGFLKPAHIQFWTPTVNGLSSLKAEGDLMLKAAPWDSSLIQPFAPWRLRFQQSQQITKHQLL